MDFNEISNENNSNEIHSNNKKNLNKKNYLQISGQKFKFNQENNQINHKDNNNNNNNNNNNANIGIELLKPVSSPGLNRGIVDISMQTPGFIIKSKPLINYENISPRIKSARLPRRNYFQV